MQSTRTSQAITLSVWKALFLRESLSRLFSTRGAWFWLLSEPVFHIAYVVVIYSAFRVNSVGNVDIAVWIMVGMLGFFMFRRTGMQVTNAVGANKALFTYRQVKPVDTVLVRAGLEGFLMLIVSFLLLTGAALFGHDVIPADPLTVLKAILGLWLLGTGFGLIVSVIDDLATELSRIINMLMTPMYFLSGVIFPLELVPQPYRDWLLLNPVAHGLEAARMGFSPYYHAVSGLSMSYLFACAMTAIFLGLALHQRFAMRLTTQ